jgi:hypothetical protein
MSRAGEGRHRHQKADLHRPTGKPESEDGAAVRREIGLSPGRRDAGKTQQAIEQRQQPSVTGQQGFAMEARDHRVGHLPSRVATSLLTPGQSVTLATKLSLQGLVRA